MAVEVRTNLLYAAADPRIVQAYMSLTVASIGVWLLVPIVLVAYNGDVVRGETLVRRASVLAAMYLVTLFNVPAWLQFLPESTVKVAEVRDSDAANALKRSLFVVGFESRAAWKLSGRIAFVVQAALLFVEDIPLITLNMLLKWQCGLWTFTAVASTIASVLCMLWKLNVILTWCYEGCRFDLFCD